MDSIEEEERGGGTQNTENCDSDGSRGRCFVGGSRNEGIMIAQRKDTGFGPMTGGGGTGVAAAGNGSLPTCKTEDDSHDVTGTEHNKPSHEAAAAAAVANLQSIASESVQTPFNTSNKRKAVSVQIQSNGYNPDDESGGGLTPFQKTVSRVGASATSTSSLADVSSVKSEQSHIHSIKSDATPASLESSMSTKGSRKKMNDFKREERNAREKG